jgi:hypothetical protein
MSHGSLTERGAADCNRIALPGVIRDMRRMPSSAVGDQQQSPEALLAELADNLDAGFVGFVRAHQHLVYSVALRITGSPADADDLTSESFLSAYRALRTYGRRASSA